MPRTPKDFGKGIDDDDSNDDLVSRAIWLRTAAGHHTKLANRLINLARTMKPKVNDIAAEIDRQLVNGKTVKAYLELAGKCSKKKPSPMNKRTLSK